jgi:hypothetical protein
MDIGPVGAATGQNYNFDIFLDACTLSSSTTVGSLSGSGTAAMIYAQNLNGSNGHHFWSVYGQLDYSASGGVGGGVAPKYTPNNASNKFEGEPHFVPMAPGETTTVSCQVYCSVVGDGAAYNGNRPRLIAKANPSIGLSNDTVLATSTTASNGAFETISGAMPAVTDYGVVNVIVDCDGTAGWVYSDNWTISGATDTFGDQSRWYQGRPTSGLRHLARLSGQFAYWAKGLPYTGVFSHKKSRS